MTRTIKTLLIANRGEIAVRIIRAARDLGLRTVQVVSTVDYDMLAARLADEVVEIGPAPANQSYLNIDRILAAAKESGADAIHPGYGFLSENAEFARRVEEMGLIFCGPDAETIERMGDKVNARAAAIAADVPVVPGSKGRITDIAEAITVAEEIGYPVMVKAAAGGGGRGIRVAHSRAELENTLPTAMNEARAGFGDDGLYVEAFIQRARHIEVQILGDGKSAIHLFERECSLQRRRQKVWEEAPAVMLPAAVREELCASAVRLAQEVGYRGAGTLEYLYDMDREAFYFIEMNTRIQVEHPVTEMITGVDLLREMILIAGGGSLTIGQEDVRCAGHAIEVRLNAENPANGFLPAPGVVETLKIPGGPGVRFDTGIYEGYGIPPYYDSLLGKLIVWDVSRARALDRLAGALGELSIGPGPTTAALYAALVRNADVRAGDVSTNWLESWLEEERMTALQSGSA
ncbi:acetyl-CoA carboxylase biotin carboxylase subunit [Roseovarius sp. PS-C2]|uniref:acetyl-CoA carboxylase biotin carboxylase subunit n=1 Tax=Roseovarius sp. PS-C2 TaxID=2820814 RepID=UPI001C0E5959|nr:acetyl-CoA carboxylase biotin carboxylase subunit [Roseovarius sp. PS-C2]MBU3261931.1 acetyl-CoA carboxylase biotin carboxylase subunit [Roseovarius sp. PS-C2]